MALVSRYITCTSFCSFCMNCLLNECKTIIMKNLRENQTIRYRKKYKFVKMRIRSLILENAALCDEVARIQESIMIVKDERKFLLHKLLEYENDREISQARVESVVPNGSKSKPKKRHSMDDSGKNSSVQ